MSHQVFRQRLLTQIEDTLRRARSADGLNNASLAGLCRELVLDGLLRPLLPTEYGIGTGKIVDSTGQSSKQIDLVVYHRSSIPPIMWSARDGVFPIEACRYAIEVKTCLRSHMIKEIETSAKQVLNLQERRRSQLNALTPTKIPFVLFAFDSDTKTFGRDLFRFWGTRPQKITGQSFTPARSSPLDGPVGTNVICIATTGYAAYDAQIRGWVGQEADSEYGHIISFLLGIVNTLLLSPSSSGDLLFGPYVCDVRMDSGQTTRIHF